MTFTKIESTTTARQVIDQILEAIRNGHYAAGDRLPSERDLAKMLGISRPTLREAITTLATLGILEIRTGIGTFVRSATIDENLAYRAADLLSGEESPLYALEARILLEPGIAALAAERSEKRDRQKMAYILQEIKELADQNKPFSTVGLNFHMAIVRSIRNPVAEHACTIALALWYNNLEMHGWGEVVKSIVTQPGRLLSYYQNLEQIYRAIEDRDGPRAAELMYNHLIDLQEDFLRY